MGRDESTARESVASDVFDRPTAWRAEAAVALGLDGDDLVAALSPGAAFPAALRSMSDALPRDVRVLVDVGAGAGGASEWLRRATGAAVIAVEPAAVAASIAADAFDGGLMVVRGGADAVPLADGVADVVTWCGVLSLVADLEPVLREARRVLRSGGVLAVADLWAAGDADVVSGPNSFRSVESMQALLRAHHFELSDVGFGPTGVSAEWDDVAEAVDRWLRSHHRSDPAHRVWEADQRHLRRHIDAGDLIGGCLVACATVSRESVPQPAIGAGGAVGSGIGGSDGIGVGTGSSGRSGSGRVGGGSVGVSYDMGAPRGRPCGGGGRVVVPRRQSRRNPGTAA